MNEPLNLFSELPPLSSSEEQFATLLSEPGLVIQRIVSTGQASPAGFWYDQAHAEWVLLLVGAALLRFEDSAEAVNLRPGTFIEIAAGRRHRVEWTQPGVHTVWLAIHRPST